jgi:hypothetical protein
VVLVTGIALIGTALAAAPDAKPGGGGTISTTYTGLRLGVLPGDRQSFGLAVNDRGSVAGFSVGEGGERAIYWNPTGMYQLTTSGATGHANGIAGGVQGPEYVAGDEIVSIDDKLIQRAVIWTNPPSGTMTFIDDAGSSAYGVNRDGAVAGAYGVSAAIWSPNADGSYKRTVIPRVAEYPDATAVDIDDDGVVIVNAYRTNSDISRGLVRLIDGTLITLQPLAGDDRTNVRSVSNIVVGGGNRYVYVAGSSQSAPETGRGVRWTVDVDTGAVTALALNQTGSAGVNGSGDVAGTVDKASTQNAVLWRSGTTYQLKPPKGSRVAGAYGLARTATSPTYVIGVTLINNWPQAVRWTIQ